MVDTVVFCYRCKDATQSTAFNKCMYCGARLVTTALRMEGSK